MFYIYFLYSPDYDKYYVGHTDNVSRRIKEHNNSNNLTYTCKYRPWQLTYNFKVSESRGDALKIEKFIKKQKSRKLIEKIIREKLTFDQFKWILN